MPKIYHKLYTIEVNYLLNYFILQCKVNILIFTGGYMSVLYAISTIRNPILDIVFQCITYLGEETFVLVAVLVCYWCINKRLATRLLFMSVAGNAINSFLKMIFQVPRPWIKDSNFQIVESARHAASGYSFPSGHTQNATGFFGTLAIIHKKTRWLSILCIVLIGFSRLYLGVHTLQDVLTSIVIAILLIWLVDKVYNNANEQTLFVGLIVFCILALLILPYIPIKRSGGDAIIASLYKDSYLSLGTALGLFIGVVFEKRYINFAENASLISQIIKCIFGIFAVLLIRIVLKPLLNSFLPMGIATCIRYFAISFFAIAIWPMSFKFISNIKH